MKSDLSQQLLDAYRARNDLSGQREDAAWANLQRRVAAGDAPRFGDAPPVDDAPGSATPSRRFGWMAVAATAAAAALVVGLVEWSSSTSTTEREDQRASLASYEAPLPEVHEAHHGENAAPRPRPPVRSSDDTDPGPPSQASTSVVRITEASSEVPHEELEPTAPAPRRRTRSKRRATPTSRNAMSRELELLRSAQLALGREAPRNALRHLQTHAREFPRGALTPERQGLRAIAACRLGRNDGPSRARAFLAAHPESTLAPRVRTTCVDEPQNSPEPPTRISPAADK